MSDRDGRLIDILAADINPEMYRGEFQRFAERIAAAETELHNARADRDELVSFIRDEKSLSLGVIAGLSGLTKQRVHQITQ